MKFQCLRAAAILLALLLLLLLGGCRRTKPPALEEIYDTAVELIERSYAVNDLVFGHGLPVWETDSAYAELKHIYTKKPVYENVTKYASVVTVSQIKNIMAQVYSEDYLESLFATMFDGYAYEEGVMVAQIKEDALGLYQSRTYEPLVTNQRIYDYATMRVVNGDEQTAVILIDTHLEHEQTTLQVELVLVKENGEWRLDTPTY